MIGAFCRPQIIKFMMQCHEVAARIMSCFAVGLGLPEDFFADPMDPKHDDCGTVSSISIAAILITIEF